LRVRLLIAEKDWETKGNLKPVEKNPISNEDNEI